MDAKIFYFPGLSASPSVLLSQTDERKGKTGHKCEPDCGDTFCSIGVAILEYDLKSIWKCDRKCVVFLNYKHEDCCKN